MPLAGDKEFKLKSRGGNFTSNRYHLVMKRSLIVLGGEIPEAGMQKMPAVPESLDDGIKSEFDFSILTVPTLPPPHRNKHQLLFFSDSLF